jgi:hypothetical protein
MTSMPYNQLSKIISKFTTLSLVILALTSCSKAVDYKGIIIFLVSGRQISSEIEINCNEKMVITLDSSSDRIDDISKKWMPINDLSQQSIDLIASTRKKYHDKNSNAYFVLKEHMNGYQSKAMEKYIQVCIEPKVVKNK